MPSGPDLGPLPRADGGAELQRESFRALASALPVSDWVARDERIEDFGVDLALELLAAGAATNVRAQVQLKGRRGLSPNADGSYSVPVATSNLNYLLNGLTPLYVLYRPEDRELWYAFARDELRRIEERNGDWKTQTEITLRFAERLDGAGLDRIRERVLREALGMRRLQDVAISLAPGTRISVDAATLQPLSPVETERFLLENGTAATAAGFGNQVLALYGTLGDARVAANPKLSLVRGYAEFSRGHYLRADVPLREALVNGEQLGSDDRCFLQFLVEAVALALGQTSRDEFRERTREWRKNAPAAMAAQYDLLDCWLVRLAATSEAEARKSDAALREAVARIRALPGMSSRTQEAEMTLLFSQAQERVFALSEAIVAATDSRLWRLRFTEPPRTVVAREIAGFMAIRARFLAIIGELQKAAHLPLLCSALYSSALCDEMLLGYQTMAAQITGQATPTVPEALVERARQTAAFTKQHDQIELWLRAGLLEADLEDLRGNSGRAKELAAFVRDRARALRFADIERLAALTANGDGMHAARKREIEAVVGDNLDSWFLSLTDAQKYAMTQETLVSHRLPSASIRFIREGLECEIDGARERYTWCRHLNILERDTGNTDVAFTRSPEHCCRCERFGWQSILTDTDWRPLIPAFKRAYCDACSVREPKSCK
jgi:hypothetical protein